MSRERRFRTLPCLALLILCTAPLHAQTPLGDAFTVNTDPRTVYRSRVAINAQGEFVVAWYGYNQTYEPEPGMWVPLHRVAARRFLSYGNPAGDEFTVAEHFIIDYYVGSVAATGPRDFLVSFASGNWTWGPEPTGHVVVCDSLDGRTDIVGGIRPLLSESTPHLETAVFPSGNFLMVWEEWGVPRFFARCFGPDGVPVSPVVEIGEAYARGPDVAVDANGNGVLVWGGCSGSYYTTCTDVYRQRFDESLNLLGPAEIVNTSVDSLPRTNLHVAMNPSGRSVVTWVEQRGPSNDRKDRLRLRVYDDAGDAVGPESAIDTLEARVYSTAVAMSDDGLAIIIRYMVPAPGYDVVWDTWNNTVASTFQIANYTPAPDVAINAADRFVVTWITSGHVLARVFDLDVQVPVFFGGVTAAPDGKGIRLEWTADATEPFAGFRVYRDDVLVASESVLGTGTRGYLDVAVEAGRVYRYEVAAVMSDGSITRSMPVTVRTPAAVLALAQNVPNPFHPSTTISYTLAQPAEVRLEVFTVDGRRVRTLASAFQDAGTRSVTWDGRDTGGYRLASGVYFYRLRAGNQTLTRRMTLVR